MTTDSQSWFFNRFDAGSLGHFEVVRREDPHNLIVKATYTYNNGQPGWVMARITDGRVQCLQYWDKNFCKLVGLLAGSPTVARRDYGQERSQSPDDSDGLGDCLMNNPFTYAGHACREMGVGVEAENDRAEQEEAQRQENAPEPEQPSMGGGD